MKQKQMPEGYVERIANNPEILNIEYHRCRLCLKVLNDGNMKRRDEQASALGVSSRTLFRMMIDFRIIFMHGKYFINQNFLKKYETIIHAKK